jgi:hypothetical protein
VAARGTDEDEDEKAPADAWPAVTAAWNGEAFISGVKPRCPADAEAEADADADKRAERKAGDLSGVCGGMRATGVGPASRSRFLRSIELPWEKAPGAARRGGRGDGDGENP